MTRALLGVLAALGVGIAGYLALPAVREDMGYVYHLLGGATVALALAGYARHRTAPGAGWLLVVAGYGCWVAGDVAWNVEILLGAEMFPAVSDVLYVSAYAVIAAGLLVILRARRDTGGRNALLDAAIVTAGAGLFIVVFVIVPVVSDTTLTLTHRLVVSTYPLGDLVLLAIAARLWTARALPSAACRLLIGSLLMMTTADIAWNVLAIVVDESVEERWTDGLWLTSYLLLAAATCHPSMRASRRPPQEVADSGASRARLVALTAGLLLPGLVLLLDGISGTRVSWPVIGLGSLLLSALVAARLLGLLRVVQVQAAQLGELARSDALTGLPNRRTWDHELARACQTARDTGLPLSVALLDLDRFKCFNDRYGHQMGDQLLKEAAAAWTERLGRGATLARYGGEEFAVLLPGTGTADAVVRVDALRSVVPRGQTVSAGVATWSPETDAGSAIAAADQALYAAKRAGRNRVLAFDGPDGAGAVTALPPFEIVVQPIVEIGSRAVIGHEALARFPGSERNVAQEFRLAHSHGHGDLLEAAAVTAAMQLPDRPPGQSLFVNVSTDAMASDRFWAALPERLDGVVVELRQDAGTWSDPGLATRLGQLRRRGARIALDDLGAGLAELARLATLRPDVVKIDRSMVDGCATHPERSAVLQALAAYAENLHVSVCAEGVEDAADLEHLAQLGIPYAQGYLLGHPAAGWRHEAASLAVAG